MDFDILKSQLDISFDENTKKNILEYIDFFNEYNSHTNLISKNDAQYLFEKHIFDSLAFNLFVKKYTTPKNILDIGTGGGFPSILLSFLLKNSKITGVDSTNKKIRFIKDIKTKFDIKNLNPICSRIEDLPKNLLETFDTVTTRALGELPLILEYGIPFLKTNGYFVAYKSVDSDKELEKAKNTLKILNTELIDIIPYKLPLKENFDRKLLIFQKKRPISKIYPRPYNIIKKSSL